MAHNPKQADGLDSHSNNLDFHPSISTEQYKKFSRKLHTLRETIDDIVGSNVQTHAGAEMVDAMFMRCATSVGKELALLSAETDAAYRERRPDIYDGGEDLLRNEDGDVLPIHEHPEVRSYHEDLFFVRLRSPPRNQHHPNNPDPPKRPRPPRRN
jgi:hypothetical protein